MVWLKVWLGQLLFVNPVSPPSLGKYSNEIVANETQYICLPFLVLCHNYHFFQIQIWCSYMFFSHLHYIPQQCDNLKSFAGMGGRRCTPVKSFLLYKKYSPWCFLFSLLLLCFFFSSLMCLLLLSVDTLTYGKAIGKGDVLTSGDFRFWLAQRGFGEMI